MRPGVILALFVATFVAICSSLVIAETYALNDHSNVNTEVRRLREDGDVDEERTIAEQAAGVGTKFAEQMTGLGTRGMEKAKEYQAKLVAYYSKFGTKAETPTIPKDPNAPIPPKDPDAPILAKDLDAPIPAKDLDAPIPAKAPDAPIPAKAPDAPIPPKDPDAPNLPKDLDPPNLPKDLDAPNLPKDPNAPNAPKDPNAPNPPKDPNAPKDGPKTTGAVDQAAEKAAQVAARNEEKLRKMGIDAGQLARGDATQIQKATDLLLALGKDKNKFWQAIQIFFIGAGVAAVLFILWKFTFNDTPLARIGKTTSGA